MVGLAAFSMADALQSAQRLIYIVLGFSLVIFLHELGHFIVARLCSVKCLAFSIGIGPRLCGWRKNGGLTFGADPYDPDVLKKKEAEAQAAAKSDLPMWLPLGGYVRMLGQDDMDPTKISADPKSFNQRPIWQRMCIVSAGVTMNLIFAAVCFSIIFSPGIGVDFPPAKIGTVAYDSPAWKAGLRPGDEITQIDDEKPLGFLEFTDIQMYSALSTGDEQLKFMVKKAGTDKSVPVEIKPVRSSANGFLAIGVESMPGTKLVGAGEDYKKDFDDAKKEGSIISPWMTTNLGALEQIRKNDRITKVDNQDIHGKYMDLYEYIQRQGVKPVTLTLVDAKDAAQPAHTITLVPHIERLSGVGEYPSVLGLAPRMMIAGADKKSPAAREGIKAGDRVVFFGERSYPTINQFRDIVTNSAGKPLEIRIERDVTEGSGEKATHKTDFFTKKLAAKRVSGTYLLGVGITQDVETASFIPPTGDSPAAALDLPADARIVKVGDQSVHSWDDIYVVLRGKSAGTIPVTFQSSRGEQTVGLPFTDEERTAINQQLHYMLGIHLEVETQTQVANNAGQAFLMGIDHTKKFILNVYQTLYGLFNRTVDPSNLHGIVGITKVGYDVQERGTVWLWYVLAMVSVNLAVANFLPLPIVDGGLFLLLILEKVRGKPLSLKVQTAIQTAGIVLLASLFLFVTMNDIKLF
jgi:regulator of sigma E protease